MPQGVWAAEEYEKLPAYDGDTLEQVMKGAFALFYCHQNDGHLCAGWVGCHDTGELLAMRINEVAPETYSYESPVPLFASGQEAAEHGLAGVDDPSEEAMAAMSKLLAKRRQA